MQAQSLQIMTNKTDNFWSRIGTLLVGAYLIVSILVFIAAPVLAYRWSGNPMIGFFIPRSREHLRFSDFLLLYLLPYVVGLAFLFTGVWAFAFRKRNVSLKIFTLFTVSVGLTVALLFETDTTRQLLPFWILTVCMSGASFFAMAMNFPERDPFSQSHPMFGWLVYCPGILLYLFGLYTLLIPSGVVSFTSVLGMMQAYLVAGFIFFLVWMGYRWIRTGSPGLRAQYQLVLIGISISFLPSIGWITASILRYDISFSPYLLIPLPFFTLATSSIISGQRLIMVDYIARQTLLYSILTILTATAYSLLITGIILISGGTLGMWNPFLIGLFIAVLIIVFMPLREKLQRIIDRLFNRNQEQHRHQIQVFSHGLTETWDANGINTLLRKIINESISPVQFHVFILHPGSDHYTALPDENGKATSELLFPPDCGLVKLLSARRAVVFIGDSQSIPALLLPELPRISLLGAVLFIPLPGRKKLIGWIALGHRRSNRPLNRQDLGFLETLSDQAALAFERAQAVEDLERRIHQITVLNRITQGINLTTSYDDILELIYAQSTQILPTRDFKISLIDSRTDQLNSIFFLEEDERFSDLENEPVPQGVGLENEVVSTGRAIITQDYERECRNRGVTSATKGIFAWIGVPLNTRDITIGVLSLGSRDGDIFYTSEQVNLLQAIADQAAGAIVKAGLLDEAERRARQLTTLNEVARSMSLTLDLVPLLNQILSSAVEMLNANSGNLLLMDDEASGYTYRAMVGPGASTLLGTRLAPGSGYIDQAVTQRQAVIVKKSEKSNGLTRSKPASDENSCDRVIVPMLYRDEVSGVIEVKDRKDNLPFSKDDVDLLTAFSSQAAIALENARLFTLTDQRLAERVEELSILQKIDRELNTSLDIEKALKVTLGWAMNQTQAEAGLISMMEGDTAPIMASEGYKDNVLKKYQSIGLPLNLPAVQDAIHTGLPQITTVKTDKDCILQGAQQQVIIPLRRESQTTGLVFLESQTLNAAVEETIGFLDRLADHASIAIENARLYAAVQDANQAKSDFVSFVSHELKTPMTSIRGFSDLIASEIVGPINENQANFLNTIRSNVDRMSTLVSDLTDISRIEAGKLHLEFSSIPFTEVIDEIVRSTRTQILAKKQTLILNVPEGLPDVWGDRTRLIQVLTNLVSNANKYTQPEGLIQIFAESTDNEWTNGSPRVLHVSVQDNGYGISEESQMRIYQKFYRSDDQKIRDSSGTGLGLNITKQLVELQGGHIWFKSEFRQGTTFHFIIPITESI